MTERTMRARLRKAGWRTTNYACINLILTAAYTRNRRIRPCWTSGRGRFTSNLDHREQLVRALRVLGMGFQEGNDSPRGGLTGQWVDLDQRSMRLLRGMRQERHERMAV